MLAVGLQPDDRINRLTRGDSFTCCYGSEEEHGQLSAFCLALQDLLSSMGLKLSDFTPEELECLLRAQVREGDRL